MKGLKALMMTGEVFNVERYDEIAQIVAILKDEKDFFNKHPILEVHSLEEVAVLINENGFVYVNEEMF